MEIDPIIADYVARKVADDFRLGRELAGSLVVAVYKYPMIDRIRALIKKSDREPILELIAAHENDVAIWSFAVGGLLRPLRDDPQIRKFLEESWGKYRSFDRRYHLLFRLLDYDDLDLALRADIWEFVQHNLADFCFGRSEWYGGPGQVLKSVRQRLHDPSFSSQKKWIYLVSLLASNNHEDAKALLQQYADDRDAFVAKVAQHLLERAEDLWNDSAHTD